MKASHPDLIPKLPLSIFHREKERIYPVKDSPMPKNPPENVIAKRVGY